MRDRASIAAYVLATGLFAWSLLSGGAFSEHDRAFLLGILALIAGLMLDGTCRCRRHP